MLVSEGEDDRFEGILGRRDWWCRRRHRRGHQRTVLTHHITLLDWASIITIPKLTRRTLLANVLIFVPLQVPYSMHYAAPNIHHVWAVGKTRRRIARSPGQPVKLLPGCELGVDCLLDCFASVQ